MKRPNPFFATFLLLIALLPPWDVTWISPSTGTDPSLPSVPEFVGFHFWGYQHSPRTKVIAWDGVDFQGGNLVKQAKPAVKYPLHALELGAAIGLWLVYGSLRKREGTATHGNAAPNPPSWSQ